jgi:UDP-glucose 4-epimerase
VDDVVSANIFAAENLGGGQIYNVGTGIETPFNTCVDIINKYLGTDIKPIYCDPANKSVQRKYVDRQLFDTDKLAQAGWKYTITIDEGIRRIVENIKCRP